MSLEKAITELTAVVARNNELLEQAITPAPKTVEKPKAAEPASKPKKAAPAPEPEEEVEETEAEEAEEAPPPPKPAKKSKTSIEDVRTALRDYSMIEGKPATVALIKSFKTATGETANTASELQPKDYDALIARTVPGAE